MNFSVIPNILIKWIVSASQAELKISENSNDFALEFFYLWDHKNKFYVDGMDRYLQSKHIVRGCMKKAGI